MNAWAVALILMLSAPPATSAASTLPSGDIGGGSNPTSVATAQRGYGIFDPLVSWLRGPSAGAEGSRANPPRPDPTNERSTIADTRQSGLRRVLRDLWQLFLNILRQAALLIPLYSRIARSRALDHEARRRLLDAVRSRPGVPLSEVAREAGLHYKTAAYHLRRLASVGLLRSDRDRKFVRVWPIARTLDQPDLHGTKRRIVDLLRDQPSRTRAELAEALGISPQGVGLHLTALVSSGVIRAEDSRSTSARKVYRLAA